MTRSRPSSFLASVAVIALFALTLAACGGGGAATAGTVSPPKTSTGASATVGVANSSLGSILVDSTGRTLYLFKADVGIKSACSGACATAWPPLLATGKPTAGTGSTASKLGTAPRSGGAQQVTYNGHPLYLFVKDTKPGDVTGQGVSAFGAGWFALSPSGSQISATPPSSASGGASSGGGGY
jgi:predicted lipoprotein with Yx(FWY)xxD motif